MYTKEFKINLGSILKDNNRNLTIIDKEYREYTHKPNKYGKIYIQNQKWYKYICNKCNYEGWTRESHLLKKLCGCPCCSSKIIVLGINTIWDTDRWMMDLGVSEEDAKKYTKKSNKKITVTCPDCQKQKTIKISDMYRRKSIHCICSDKKPYTEKFVTSVLNQLNVEFETQLTKTILEWCNDKRYDFYLPKYNMIIETHGGQHYQNSFEYYGGRTLQEEQKNDKVKEYLAKDNGIDNYIILDCRYSNSEYIKTSILNSELNNVFDLSKIDWVKCEEFALKNIIKEVCEYWNNKEDWETTQTIADNNNWGIRAKLTIRKYLKIGSKLGWCNYNAKKESAKIGSKNGFKNNNKVEVFKDGISLGIFDSCNKLAKESQKILGVNISVASITLVAKGKQSCCKGYVFKYI